MIGQEDWPMPGMSNDDRCRMILNYYGGFQGIDAELSAEMSAVCPTVIQESLRGPQEVTFNVSDWTAGDAGSTAAALPLEDPMADSVPVEESPPMVSTNVPLWTVDIENPGLQESKVLTTSPDMSGPDVNFAGFFTGLTNILSDAFQAPTTPTPSLAQQIEQGAQALLPQFFQADQINTGITARAAGGLRCSAKKRRWKAVRMADGTIQAVAYCPPRRMNPLNARALGRAARRLGSFHKIASHIEKVVAKACRTGKRRGTTRLPGCSPRKRC